jgi:aromatic ring-opening dioxygenase catalytic subunit (LigB family)
LLFFFVFHNHLKTLPFRQAGIPVAADSHKGFDHGVWQPLMMMWPEGDIQVEHWTAAAQTSPCWSLRFLFSGGAVVSC